MQSITKGGVEKSQQNPNLRMDQMLDSANEL